MSALRLLAPIREAGPSTKRECSKITLELHLPTYGLIFMKPPDDPLWPHSRSTGRPRDDQLLSGVLEIHVPPTLSGARRRCKSVKVGLRTKVRLNMGTGRGWEEDTIFERKVEMMGGNSDGIVLIEGLQLFEFTLILPSTLAPHDWHPNGKVTHELFAELEGLPEPDLPSFQALSMFSFGRRRSSKSSYGSSKRGEPSRSPSPTSSHRSLTPSLSPMLSAAGSMVITRQEEASFALVPTYEQSQADIDSPRLSPIERPESKDEWIMGTIEIVKNVMVVHNPNPAGNASTMDIMQNGVLDELGVWELRLFSDVLSIGGPIHARFTLPSPDPKLTIFAWTLTLRQTHTVASPRDDPEINKSASSTRTFTLIKRGVKPAFSRNPGLEYAALWHGKEAKGEDEGECMMEASANMPRDDFGRPTTLPGLVTPIKVSHILQFQLYFSIYGEDDRGRPMAQPGPGGMRYMNISKPLILPSCALIPSLLDLPKYEQCESDEPCTECGDVPAIADIAISPSSPRTVTHTLSDTASLFSMSSRSTRSERQLKLCAECCVRHDSTEYDMHGWRLCACGLDVEDLDGRMRMFASEGNSVDERWREARCRKEAAERGCRLRSI